MICPYGNLNYSDAQYTSDFYIKQNNWIDRLFLDEVFVEKVKIRYSYYYSKLGDIKNKIDEFAKYIDKSQKLILKDGIFWEFMFGLILFMI